MSIVDDFASRDKPEPGPTVFILFEGYFGGTVTAEHIEACISDPSILKSLLKHVKPGETTSIGRDLDCVDERLALQAAQSPRTLD